MPSQHLEPSTFYSEVSGGREVGYFLSTLSGATEKKALWHTPAVAESLCPPSRLDLQAVSHARTLAVAVCFQLAPHIEHLQLLQTSDMLRFPGHLCARLPADPGFPDFWMAVFFHLHFRLILKPTKEKPVLYQVPCPFCGVWVAASFPCPFPNLLPPDTVHLLWNGL